MNAAVSLMDGLGLDGDRCIRVIPRHPPFSMKEEALPACKETIVRNIPWSLRDQVMQQIWMYYKEKLTKNLADLNTFETSMSLRDRVTTSNEPYSLCLFTYVHTALKWLRGAKILQHTPVEKSQWHLWETALSLKDRVYVLKVRLQCLFFTLLLLLWLKKLLASRPVVDTAVLLFIWCRREEFGQFLDTGWPYASTRLFLNVL